MHLEIGNDILLYDYFGTIHAKKMHIDKNVVKFKLINKLVC